METDICDYRTLVNAKIAQDAHADSAYVFTMITNADTLNAALEASGKRIVDVANHLNLRHDVVSKMKSGVRQIKSDEAVKITEFFASVMDRLPNSHSEPPARTRLTLLGPARVGATEGERVLAQLETDEGRVELLLTGEQALHMAKHLERAESLLPVSTSASLP